ncbi:gamma-glutamyl:cysteine ligase YbdK (ATP-grasp superfamily) [Thermosporothrix hazakensis]|jgi:gamma-glutamyl:cysteine ligase YbdK (ATP-grasp superfamily)|uniref:Gamma-glutamyl:cysteine ligase YbdK (ATP-grasp superfamily) n=2 Tax=Thermosporothrix TaxID=768650 RepID=A0A326U7K4_THEHA|nr:glutamate-cysteine ligase family protein [Thermosporothrix hazakensis]PZW29165.1 gamma-glutamyl:cysteine ligase YbdK (ATP-grasp superfamily) [Thermosporothrix hazakensis]BBH86091.1 hypothetical protein KTC_08420 [Thermosporothrix sp. COM3]GCE45484.1 hypothetical protein KTH_03530 [Thermosporothrix hazakensis]
MFRFGIEHEIAFLSRDGEFVDYENTPFEVLHTLIRELPLYEQDYPQLRIGEAGIKRKRWYIEGFERYNEAGEVIGCPLKGIEVRTTPHHTIQDVMRELRESCLLLSAVATRYGLEPVLIGFHPYKKEFVPDPPLNAFERQFRQSIPERRTALLSVLTYGPDFNISLAGLSAAECVDLGQKLTYYSPFIVPLSFSSPFYDGKLWGGLSIRTYQRTGPRPAVLVYLENPADLIACDPSLTRLARLPAEVGRIEFKACDSCADLRLYAGFLALLKGLVLDTTLPGRALVPDRELHQRAAQKGFALTEIVEGTELVLGAAERALAADEDRMWLEPLWQLVRSRTSPADLLIRAYMETGSIEAALRASYAQAS